MSDAPAVEIHQLTPGIEGTIEIPRLGTWDGSRIYCAYSRNTDSIWMQWTDDVGVTWSDPVPAIPNPGPRYITDANILVISRPTPRFYGIFQQPRQRLF